MSAASTSTTGRILGESQASLGAYLRCSGWDSAQNAWELWQHFLQGGISIKGDFRQACQYQKFVLQIQARIVFQWCINVDLDEEFGRGKTLLKDYEEHYQLNRN
ncbi:hypothetical protein M758_11G100600 [Ceratodon purpureus]|uniref:Uncharacterized protein n=1 Tax=Ceratodon purpureus TaxID=3225 RepID=A0A8T0GDN1_CERPU|nr:hypothetical protein KC19_11G104400 [Ceratodon purpureus]KAG0601302.1 hypothetical protein M758_11G100600 [Ceratodon purpureus]